MSKKEVEKLSEFKLEYVSDYISELVGKGIEKEHIVNSLKKSGCSQKLINLAFLKVGESKRGFLFGAKIKDNFENLKKKAHYLAEKSYNERIKDEYEKKSEREKSLKAILRKQEKEHKKGVLLSGEKLRINTGENIYTAQKHRASAVIVALFTIGLMVMSLFLFGFQYDCKDEGCFIGKANNCERTTYENVIDSVEYSYSIDGCAVAKTLVNMPDREPDSVENAFEGKSMICSYSKLNFDLNYIQGLNHNLDTCFGSLKNVIGEYISLSG